MSDYYGGGDPRGPQHPSAAGGRSQRGIFIALSAVIVAGLVVIVLAVTGVFSRSGTPAGDSPRQVVEKVLYASKRQNLDDVKASVCKRDLASPALSDVVGKDHATSYSIEALDQQSAAKVVATITITTASDTATTKLPVIKEGGAWKACFSDIDSSDYSTASPSGGPSSSGAPSTDDTTDIPTDSTGAGLCASPDDAASTARTFVSYLGLGLTDLANDCVYPGRLDEAQLKALTGPVWSPATIRGPGPTYTFTPAGGSGTITVTVELRGSHYYVTAARKS